MTRPMEAYLARGAEPEIAELTKPPDGPFNHVVVIPCCGESFAFASRLMASTLWRHKLLAIVVINQAPGASQGPCNAKLLRDFLQLPGHRQHGPLHWLGGDETGPSRWLVVDRFSPGREIPRAKGVGLARKLGCDLALALMRRGQIRSPWLHSTDADAHLPDNYFETPTGPYSAICYAYRHYTDPRQPDVSAATQLYEKAIDYYVRGLQWAGSPYAFHTLGSALAVAAHSYAAVRGFPQRAGAEDFYLLNKVAKLGPVYRAANITVGLEARLSQRAPFGTGHAVANIIREGLDATRFSYYPPACFALLKECLEAIEPMWPHLDKRINTGEGLSDALSETLNALNIAQFVQHARDNINTRSQFLKAWHQWFDAFRTLKLIRFAQTHYHTAQPLARCIANAPFPC